IDDRRLSIAFERSGKFRGSTRREASLEIGFVPTSRGARLLGDVTHVRLGARLPEPAEPRPLLAARALDAIAADDVLMRGRWMSPAVIAWLRTDPPRAAERYASLVALPADAPPPVAALFGATDAEPATPG